MKIIEGNPLAELNRRNEIYRPIAEWCVSLQSAHPTDDVTAWFYLALDKMVRHPDFDIDELRQVLVGNWFDFAEGPGAMEEIDRIVWCSRAVRQFVEARGEVKKREGGLVVRPMPESRNESP